MIKPENAPSLNETGGMEKITAAEKLINYQDNVERHKDEINKYLDSGIFQNLPEGYKDEYGKILDKHFDDLQKNPINPSCRLTLVLPAFREEKVILQTLTSLQNQEGVKPGDFEVLVLNNYPEGEKPLLNDYNESGEKIGAHEDMTAEITEKFAKISKLKIHIIEQAFPDNIKGVGAASKLGMDLALKRQKNNPQIIGYYGADTIFDKNWVKGVLDGFGEKNTDGVRGVAKGGQLDNRVEDENGLHVLSQEELNTIIDLEKQRFKYSQKLRELENIFIKNAGENKKQLAGLPAITAGMYARVGGMKAYSPKKKEAVTSGEDWQIAQDVADNGNIFWNSNMRTITLPRIEKPRAKGGSYTEGMWAMFRAYYYGEGSLLDKEKNLLVENPERTVARNNIGSQLKKIRAGLSTPETDGQLLNFLKPEELDQIKKLIIKYGDNWEAFPESVPEEIITKVNIRMDKLFPKIKLEDAEKKLDEIKNSI